MLNYNPIEITGNNTDNCDHIKNNHICKVLFAHVGNHKADKSGYWFEDKCITLTRSSSDNLLVI